MASVVTALPRTRMRAGTLHAREEKRRLETEHLRERTLTTVDGDSFQLAMSPWTKRDGARGCYVAVGCDGRIFATYTLWEFAPSGRRQLAVIAGYPDFEVTEAVMRHLRARLG